VSTATSPKRDRLTTIDELSHELREWRAALDAAVGDLSADLTDEAYQQRIKDTVERLVQVDGELHKADFDPEWIAEFRGLLLDSLRAIQNERPLDAFDKLLLNIEAMRHLLRDALDGHVEGSEEDIATVVRQLQQWLPRASQPELAGLMGISTRQYQRWGQMRSEPTRRAQIVARLIAVLRRSWTDAGVVAWFYRPRPELDDRAPIDVLDDVAYEQALFRAVRQGRAQHGA
jgi:DNA-binding transcriptional regulator YiaG